MVEKCSVCHCGKNNCHAADIALLLHELFGPPDVSETAPYFQPTPGIFEAGNGVVPLDAGLVDLTSDGINLVGSISPSSAPPWPDEWTIMVESIRGSPNGLFWEVFAGSQSVTQSLSHRGWICAPPIDVADSIDYNVLNPVFLSIYWWGLFWRAALHFCAWVRPSADHPNSIRQFLRRRHRSLKRCSERVGMCFGAVLLVGMLVDLLRLWCVLELV